jgi:hypothetical protein
MTAAGLQTVFSHMEINLPRTKVEIVLADLRKSQQGKFELSFKLLIDFLTRKRVNVAFVDKGFVDPLIA